MSLRSPVVYCIPEETARVAHAAFPKGSPYMRIADELGTLYANAQFVSLFSPTGQPAFDPARLAAVTIFQFMEGLSDEQAATAVRGRIDWKYALALPLEHPGFDSSVLSEFRSRLLAGGAETLLLETLLQRLRELGLLKARGRMRTDATHVLASVRRLTRLACVGETLRSALNNVSEQAPGWLRTKLNPDWFERYSRRWEEYRLPKNEKQRAELAASIGCDGAELLRLVYEPAAPPQLRQLPAVQVLRLVWIQQFYAPDSEGRVQWRDEADLPPGAKLIVSPYDAEARLSAKRGQMWSGYKVHWTESCDEDGPHLITQVETTAATSADIEALPDIQAELAAAELVPGEQLVDSGYISSEQVLRSEREHQIRLVGPTRPDSSWQAGAGAGFSAECFEVDWEKQQVRCPQGQMSSNWHMSKTAYGKPVISVRFAAATCGACEVRTACTRMTSKGRGLQLQPRQEHERTRQMRAEQATEEWKGKYRQRAGVEGALSQGIRVGGLRRSRYVGQAKTHLQAVLIAVAVNVLRLVDWWEERPLARTRRTALGRLGLVKQQAAA